MNTNRLWIACGCCVMVVGLATGCRVSGMFQDRKASTADPIPTASRLTGSQVSEIQVSLCRTLEQQGKLERARDGYRRILETDKKNGAAAWRLAVVSDRMGELDKSEPLFRQALEADAKNVELLADYGYSLYLKRRWAEAEKTLREGARIDPKNARLQNNLGLLLAQTDRRDEALVAFRRAGCQEAEAQSNLGLVLAMNGRDEQARQAFEKSLANRGEGKAARLGLSALQAKARRQQVPSAEVPGNPVVGQEVVPVSHEEPAVSGPVSAAKTTSERSGRSRIGTEIGRAHV